MKMAFFLLSALSSFGATSAQRYLFYLHGKIVEDQGAHAKDTINGFGSYLYEDILDAFRKNNFIVVSEVRQKDTDVEMYAKKVKEEIDSLLHKGVAASDITVVGASKGSVIAMLVSSLMKNEHMNFVFMAACNDYNFNSMPQINFCGNILSIYERTDDIGRSCVSFKNRSQQKMPHYKEIELNTGLKHGFIFKPLGEWVKPVTNWANGKYD